MNCEAIRAELDAYLDGELEETRSAEIGRHIAGCAGCRRLLEQHRAVALAVKGLPRATAPEGFNERFRNSRALSGAVPSRPAAGAPARPSLVLRLSWIGGSLAAAAALIVAVSLATSQSRVSSAPCALSGKLAPQTAVKEPTKGNSHGGRYDPLVDGEAKKEWRGAEDSARAFKGAPAENSSDNRTAAPCAAPATPAAKFEAADVHRDTARFGEADKIVAAPQVSPVAPAGPESAKPKEPRAPAPTPGAAPAPKPLVVMAPKPVIGGAGVMLEEGAGEKAGGKMAAHGDEKAPLADFAESSADRAFFLQAASLEDAESRLVAITRSLGGYRLGTGDDAAGATAPAGGFRKNAKDEVLKRDDGKTSPPGAAGGQSGEDKKLLDADPADDLQKSIAAGLKAGFSGTGPGGGQSRTVILALPADRLATFTEALASWGSPPAKKPATPGTGTVRPQSKSGDEARAELGTRHRALTASLRVTGEREVLETEGALRDQEAQAQALEKPAPADAPARPGVMAAAPGPAHGGATADEPSAGARKKIKIVLVVVTVSSQ